MGVCICNREINNINSNSSGIEVMIDYNKISKLRKKNISNNLVSNINNVKKENSDDDDNIITFSNDMNLNQPNTLGKSNKVDVLKIDELKNLVNFYDNETTYENFCLKGLKLKELYDLRRNRQDLDNAIESYTNAIKLKEKAEPYCSRAYLYALKNDFDASIADFIKMSEFYFLENDNIYNLEKPIHTLSQMIGIKEKIKMLKYKGILDSKFINFYEKMSGNTNKSNIITEIDGLAEVQKSISFNFIKSLKNDNFSSYFKRIYEIFKFINTNKHLFEDLFNYNEFDDILLTEFKIFEKIINSSNEVSISLVYKLEKLNEIYQSFKVINDLKKISLEDNLYSYLYSDKLIGFKYKISGWLFFGKAINNSISFGILINFKKNYIYIGDFNNNKPNGRGIYLECCKSLNVNHQESNIKDKDNKDNTSECLNNSYFDDFKNNNSKDLNSLSINLNCNTIINQQFTSSKSFKIIENCKLKSTNNYCNNNILEYNEFKKKIKNFELFPSLNDLKHYFYVGNFKNGLYNGFGFENVNFEINGKLNNKQHSYFGLFTNGLKSIYGKYYWKDIDLLYTGQFNNGFINGLGKLNFSDGRKYVGNIKNGIISGSGIFYINESEYYKGNFINFKKNGIGEMIIIENSDCDNKDITNAEIDDVSQLKTFEKCKMNKIKIKGHWNDGRMIKKY